MELRGHPADAKIVAVIVEGVLSCAKVMSTSASHPVLTVLRERIQRLERGAARHRSVLPFCVKTIDEHLSESGLALGALHEVPGVRPAPSRAYPGFHGL